LEVSRYANIDLRAGPMSETLTTPPDDKLLGLEALRFVAAFDVLIWHYQHFAYVADTPVDLVKAQFPFHGLLYPFYEVGGMGVWVFWCISGFIFFFKYRDAIADRSIDAWTFFVSRLSRLYPLHLVTLMMVASLQPIYRQFHGGVFVYPIDIQKFVLQLFMASDWSSHPRFSFNAPIWSVSIEVLVYAIFFLTLRFATKSPLLNVIVVVVCATIDSPISFCLSCFYAGGLAAIGRQAMAHLQFRPLVEAALWCAAVAAPISIWMFGLQSRIDYCTFLLYTLILLFCLSGKMPLSQPWQRLLRTAGNMTYSSYLLHFPIQLVIALGFAILRRPIPLYDDAFFAAFIAATLLAAFFSYRYFEGPAQTLLRGLLLSKQGSPIATPDARRSAPAG
jgi:peptidoglycan/LPS O-acetylase OafA/YrhL